jgi:hypothetical protein
MGRYSMDRRRFLRGLFHGAAVTVALPPLEAMLNFNGDALADGTPLPTRFGVWFWGNGVRPERWVPSTTGASWTPSDELQPLASLVPYVSVVSGCHIKTGTHPHHSGMTGIMTGAPLHQVGTVRDTIVSTFARQSVDQLAADYYSGLTPYRSLELGITHFRGTDEGTTFQHLSHNGVNSPNPCEYSAQALYERLFGLGFAPQVNLTRASVLDAVNDQIRALQNEVGAHDRQRLEQHFSSVRTLEQRLETEPGACMTPPSPSDHPDIAGREQIEPKNETMAQLLALALACDLTRSFSVLFSTAGSGVVVWQAGALNSLHRTSHDEPMPQPTVHNATVFTMEQLAVFLETLRGTPEGDGNLLDNCSILCTSELSDGWNHSNEDFPILIAGRGGGRLRGGVHYRSRDRENTSRAVLTALNGGGVDVDHFGVEAGRVTQTFADLDS